MAIWKKRKKEEKNKEEKPKLKEKEKEDIVETIPDKKLDKYSEKESPTPINDDISIEDESDQDGIVEEYDEEDDMTEEYDKEEYQDEPLDGTYLNENKKKEYEESDEEYNEVEDESEEYEDEEFQEEVSPPSKKETIKATGKDKKKEPKKTSPKKVDKNIDTETNTFIEIPEKYLLRITPRARAIITHFSYLIKKNRRNDKSKKKSINDISKFSSLNEFLNTCIVAYGQSLIFDQQATLKKDDLVSVDDKLITLMNLMTINTLKTNLLIRNQKAQVEAEFANDFKETNGSMPITKEDFKELEEITQVIKSLEINQNRWREEQSKESTEKDFRELEETIRVVEVPIIEDKLDKQKKELIAARKEITRLKKQLGEK